MNGCVLAARETICCQVYYRTFIRVTYHLTIVGLSLEGMIRNVALTYPEHSLMSE